MRIASIVVLLSTGAAVALPAQSSNRATCDSLQYRFVDDHPPPAARRYVNTSDGREYVLRDTVVLDASGILTVQATSHRLGADTVWDVFATLTPAAVRSWGDATASHVGQTIAVLFGGELIQTAIIQSRLGGRTGVRSIVPLRVADSLTLRARRFIASCSPS
jgi:preprotein translocase subunit SecD